MPPLSYYVIIPHASQRASMWYPNKILSEVLFQDLIYEFIILYYFFILGGLFLEFGYSKWIVFWNSANFAASAGHAENSGSLERMLFAASRVAFTKRMSWSAPMAMSGRPVCDSPKNCPGPRISKSFSASSNPFFAVSRK